MELGMLPTEGRNLILAGAILSITINSLVFPIVERRVVRRLARVPLPVTPFEPEVPAQAPPRPDPAPAEAPAPEPTGHDVVIGYGRVGSLVGARLVAAGRAVLVFEDNEAHAHAARRDGATAVIGNAADPAVLAAADLAAAARLFVTIPEPFEAGQVVEQARAINPALPIFARAHSDDAVRHLERLGATRTIMGEREIAARMLDEAELGVA
jgi:CPA2 family monovalent cation:H+ antiporter-2